MVKTINVHELKDIGIDEERNGIVIILNERGKEYRIVVPSAIACRFAGTLLNKADRQSRRKRVNGLPEDLRAPVLDQLYVDKGIMTPQQAKRALAWASGEVHVGKDRERKVANWLRDGWLPSPE